MRAKTFVLELDNIGEQIGFISPPVKSFLHTVNDRKTIQQIPRSIYGQSTVPNIFINGNHMGGNSDLQARKAELPELHNRAGAL